MFKYINAKVMVYLIFYVTIFALYNTIFSFKYI